MDTRVCLCLCLYPRLLMFAYCLLPRFLIRAPAFAYACDDVIPLGKPHAAVGYLRAPLKRPRMLVDGINSDHRS
jgi:hypothetical protein